MIKVNNLSFSYNKEIFNNLNLIIPSNKITLIIGKNGTGKSTLAYLLSGLLKPNTGTIAIDELLLTKKTNNLLIRKKIGIVFQNPNNQILFTNVYEDIKFTLENMNTPSKDIDNIIKESLATVDMIDFINSNPYKLSGGQKQRLAIASQLATKPKYLILDEATSMLDNQGKKDIYKLINKLKKEMGIIFITNNINELIYADNIIIIEKEKLYQYNIEEIINNPTILTKHHYDIPFIIKIAKVLNIKEISKINEEYLLERINALC